MPRMLLDQATAGSAGPAFARRRWYSVPASIAVHGVLLMLFVLAPLIAPVRLPPLPSAALEAYVVSIAPMPDIPLPRPRQTPPAVVQAAASAAPVEAPRGVAPETGIEVPADALRDLIDETTDVVVGLGGGLPPEPTLPPPVVTAPVPIGGNIRRPERLAHVAPVYPPVAQAARIEGVVVIEATISPAGQVTGARVLRGVPLLDDAALSAVRQWRYTPTLLNGLPVPVIMTVTVQFKLRDPHER